MAGARALTYGTSSRAVTRAGARGVEIIVIDSQQRQLPLVCVAAPARRLTAACPAGTTRGLLAVPFTLACCCTSQKTLYKNSCTQLILPRTPGIGRPPLLLPMLRVPFSFGVTRSASAAHDSASRNGSARDVEPDTLRGERKVLSRLRFSRTRRRESGSESCALIPRRPLHS